MIIFSGLTMRLHELWLDLQQSDRTHGAAQFGHLDRLEHRRRHLVELYRRKTVVIEGERFGCRQDALGRADALFGDLGPDTDELVPYQPSPSKRRGLSAEIACQAASDKPADFRDVTYCSTLTAG